MIQTSSKPSSFPRLRARRAGSAILAALGFLAITSVVVGAALFEARSRFRTTHHSSRWTQASHAAEAGADLTLMSAQNNFWTAHGWTSGPGAPGAPAVTKTFSLSTGAPATDLVSASVSVSKVFMGGLNYLRIRSKGEAEIAGGAVAGLDSQDVMLRKLSLRTDRSTGATLATPRAIRTIEVLAKPVSPFRKGILLDRQFAMSGGLIDSFDSSDPTKSTNTRYDVAKRQSNGDVGVNDTGGNSDLSSQFVYGDVMYSGPAITGTSNVQGEIITPFNDPIQRVLKPTWTSVNPSPSSVTTSMTLTGSSISTPARFKVSEFNLSGGTVTFAPHASGAQSYVEIWVTGEFKAGGNSQVIIQPGVHVTFFIEGNITATGTTFVNQTNVAENNVLNQVNPEDNSAREVVFTGGGEFIGAMNAPAADLKLTGNADFSGAMIGKTMTAKGGARIHYDEALSRAALEGGGFKVVSWVESVR